MEKRNGQRPTFSIPKIIVTDYDADLTEQQQQQPANTTNRSPKSSPNKVVLNESEEEVDREIIESLTRAHPTNCERNVDDEVIASTSGVCRKNTNVRETTDARTSSDSETEIEVIPSFDTDDEIADQEVSRLTSSLESNDKYVSVPRSVLALKRPNVTIFGTPPGTLPNINGVHLPLRYAIKSIAEHPFEIPTVDFQPLKHMSFSPEIRLDSSSEYFSANDMVAVNETNDVNRRVGAEGTSKPKPPTGGTKRLHGEIGCDTPSSATDAESSLHWKLHKDSSDGSTDGGSKEDIDQILDTYHVVGDDSTNDVMDVAGPSSLNNLNSLLKKNEEQQQDEKPK